MCFPAALGRDEEAVADLRKAAELCPDAAGQADILSDIAKVYQKQKDHRRTETELKVGWPLSRVVLSGGGSWRDTV